MCNNGIFKRCRFLCCLFTTAVLQCHGATEPGVHVYLGAVAGFCDKYT